MKTLTTTLSIFALLLSTTAFSLNLTNDIEPAKRPKEIPPMVVNIIQSYI